MINTSGTTPPIAYSTNTLQFLIPPRSQQQQSSDLERQLEKLNRNLDRQISQGSIIKNFFPEMRFENALPDIQSKNLMGSASRQRMHNKNRYQSIQGNLKTDKQAYTVF